MVKPGLYRPMTHECKHLGDLLKTEASVIKRHFKNHKWFKHLKGDAEAQIDFIDKYGFIMREMYCGYICSDREDCYLAREFIPIDEKPLYEQLEFKFDK